MGELMAMDERRDDTGLDDATLRRAAARLGTRAAERVDVEQVAGAVVRRLREPDVVPLATRLRRATPRWLPLAAALVVLAGGALVARRLMDDAVPATAGAWLDGDLAELDADQLTELLRTLDQALDSTAAAVDADSLDADQLEALLASWEEG
jgi:hypothetical protein